MLKWLISPALGSKLLCEFSDLNMCSHKEGFTWKASQESYPPKSDWIHSQGTAVPKRVAGRPGPWSYPFIGALLLLGAFIGRPLFQGLQQMFPVRGRGELG